MHACTTIIFQHFHVREWACMFNCILSHISAKWLHRHVFLHACHVPELPHGDMGMPVLVWCVQVQPLSSVGVPVCTPAVFRHYLMMAWHTCSHTYLGPAPTHDVTGSSVLTSTKFLCYQVVVQACLLARQPCLSDSTCWHSKPPFSSAVPQCHQVLAQAYLFICLLCLSIATWQQGHGCFHTCQSHHCKVMVWAHHL